MPVIRRKLASSPAPRTRAVVRTSIKEGRLQLAPAAPQQVFDQRGMNVRASAKYLGVSVWQIRKFIREDDLRSFRIGNRDMIDRLDLDALIERLKSAAA